MTTQTWLANTTAKSEAAAGTAVTLRAAQSGSSKKLTVNSGLISFLQNSSALTMSGYSLTGSQATSLLDMTGTWNTSGAPTALKLNVTDTNSNASSALLDLQVGGVSQFKVSKAGAVTAVGVAIPTISSSDTLSNKTLSSPVLSGTVAGSPTFSGALVMSGSVYPIRVNDGGYIRFYNASSGVDWALGKPDANQLIFYRNGSAWFQFDSNGAPFLNGVAVPTISSTDTLSNKTLSSPTLSGTTTCGAINVSAASVAATINSTNNAYVLGISYASTTGGYIGTTSAGNLRLTDSTLTTMLDVNTAKVVTTGTLQANKTTSAASPDTSSNSITNVIFRVAGSNVGAAGYGIDMGVSNSDGTSWIQSRDQNNYATNTTLRLNPNGGGATLGGVAIPTISSTDTLTNKTISSPTLSGTVAGSPALTGQWQWSGGNDAAYWHAIVLAPTDAGNNKPSLYITHTSSSAYAIGLYDGADTDGTIAFNCGVLNHNGAAITTTTNTQTLTNKTLSSPTLSGTVAGTPTFSGSPIKIGDGTDTVAMTGTSPQLKVQGASFSTGITVRRDGNAEVGIQSTGTGNIGTWTNHPVNLFVNAANRIEFNTSLMTFNDAYDIAVGTTTGTKIGTSTSQKLGFFNKTPVVQPTAVADATDAASVITQLNALLSRMRDLGLIAT